MLKKAEKLFTKKILVFAALALFTLIIYSNSFKAPFTLDDFSSIENNYAIRNPLDLGAIWKFYSNRFVLYFTLSLDYFVHGNDVIGYHIVNTAIHILNGMLVFLIVKKILGLGYFKKGIPGKYPNVISMLLSLVFLAHPVQVNAVTYIIQRTAALAATFYFLAILFYLKFRTTDKIRYFLLTLLFTVIAMFTKENTITIPFMLAFIEFLFFLKDGRTSWWKRIIFLLILFLTLPIIPSTVLYLGGYSQSDPGNSFKASTSMDRFVYFYTELNVIMRYIKILFIPDNLCFDYSNDFPMSNTIWENNSYISFIILLCIGVAALLCIRRNKLISLGIVWFYIGLSVESSFISIKDVYFEHRLYFPLVGFLLCITGLIFYSRKGRPWCYAVRKPLLLFTTVFAFATVFYSFHTLYRNYIFSDSIRLWSDVVEKAPNSDRAHSVLATNYLDKYELSPDMDPKYLELSEKEFNRAIELNYYNDTSHCNLSKVYLLKGEYEKCIEEAKTTISISESVYAYNNLGMGYKNLGMVQEAIDAFLSGYRLDSKRPFILKSLGNIYNEIHDYENARFYYEEFLKYNTYSDSDEVRRILQEIKDK